MLAFYPGANTYLAMHRDISLAAPVYVARRGQEETDISRGILSLEHL